MSPAPSFALTTHLTLALAGALALGLGACGQARPVDMTPALPCTGPDFAGAPLGVHCAALVDDAGREVALHGVNVRIRGLFDNVLDDGSLAFGTIPEWTPDDATAIHAMGWNAVRLTFNWSGLEPTETGGFVSAYLDRMASVVDACRAAGLYVLLDSHQDGYTKYIGDDGAPLWATLPAPPPRDPNDPNRVAGPAAQAAWKTFFSDSTDGARLRRRYAAMLVHVAQRFASDPAVIGLELMNEPIAAPDRLVAFDREMIAALRPVFPSKLLFFEPSSVRNFTDSAEIGNGSLGAGTVYAPHIYNGVFSKVHGDLSRASLEPSTSNARDEADGWQAPLGVTEWGFGPHDPLWANYVEWQQELEDQYFASAFIWLWKEVPPNDWGFFDIDPKTLVATPRPSAIASISRLRPEAIAGRVEAKLWDPVTRTLTVKFTGSDGIAAPNRVSIGATTGYARWQASCDGTPIASADPASLPCSGAGVHTLQVVPQ